MIHSIPELKVSNTEAVDLGKKDQDRLRKSRKLVLLVDLDQTLIHTTNDNIPPNIKVGRMLFLDHPQCCLLEVLDHDLLL